MARDVDVAVLKAHGEIAIGAAVAEMTGNNILARRTAERSWVELSEEEQDQQIQDWDRQNRATIDELLSALGSGGFPRIPALVESFNQGKLKVAKLIVDASADYHALSDAIGSRVTIVLTPYDTFKAAEQSHKADAESKQGDLLDGVARTMTAEGEGDATDEPDTEGDADPEDEGDRE
jgi:hypothetical protein